MKEMKINANIPVSIFKEDKFFIAYCPVLDISTSAETFEKVRDRFHEVVEIFFAELVKKGTLDEVLASHGWKKVKKIWSSPPLIYCQPEKMTVNLP